MNRREDAGFPVDQSSRFRLSECLRIFGSHQNPACEPRRHRPFLAPPLSPERKKTLGVVTKIKQTNVGNPLESPYFSARRFSMARQVAKFSVTPRSAGKDARAANPSTNYLREAMKKSLDPANGKPAVFDFKVQLRNDDSLPIEDATAEWSETTRPQAKCRDDRDRPARFRQCVSGAECEHMAFTPLARAHGASADRRHQSAASRTSISPLRSFRSQPKEPKGFPKWRDDASHKRNRARFVRRMLGAGVTRCLHAPVWAQTAPAGGEWRAEQERRLKALDAYISRKPVAYVGSRIFPLA